MNTVLDIWKDTLRLLTFQPRPRSIPQPERDAMSVDRALHHRETEQR